MAIKYAPGKSTSSAKFKVTVAATVALLVFIGVGLADFWYLAPLLSWVVAAPFYLFLIWKTIWPMDGKETESHAVREDPSRSTSDLIVLGASMASLGAVGLVLVSSSDVSDVAKLFQIGLSVVSVVAAWATVHTLFALHYAELYYKGQPGGVEFAGTKTPSYKDFAYLAFTMGMTFQVSDTGFQSTDFRRMALRHALISYLFGTVIVATTINLIAGLTK